MSSLPASAPSPLGSDDISVKADAPRATSALTSVLIVVPGLDGGASDAGAVELVRVLAGAGYSTVLVSRAGRLAADVTTSGGAFVPLDLSSNNPVIILRNALILSRLARERRCQIIHAFGRAGAWSGLIAARLNGAKFVTNWHKGFREQNLFKHLFNGIMARGDRVVASSEQIAQLINDRYGTPWNKITVVPCSIDLERFNPEAVTRERNSAIRPCSWPAP